MVIELVDRACVGGVPLVCWKIGKALNHVPDIGDTFAFLRIACDRLRGEPACGQSEFLECKMNGVAECPRARPQHDTADAADTEATPEPQDTDAEADEDDSSNRVVGGVPDEASPPPPPPPPPPPRPRKRP